MFPNCFNPYLLLWFQFRLHVCFLSEFMFDLINYLFWLQLMLPNYFNLYCPLFWLQFRLHICLWSELMFDLINYLFWLQLMSPPWFYYLLFFILTALVSTRIAYPFDFNSCQRGCLSVLISITALDVPSAPKLFRLQYGFNMSYKIFHWLIMINNGKALLLSCLHDQLSSHDSHINVDRN